jgi:hypothetical protein
MKERRVYGWMGYRPECRPAPERESADAGNHGREGRLPAWEWTIAGRRTLRYQWRDVEEFRRRYARRL